MSDIEQSYVTWRGKYLRSYEDGLYIYYKEQSEGLKEMTCSEAHGYGMLISVSKRNQQDFDGLYKYYARFRNNKGLMQWQQKTDKHGKFIPGDEGGENCATDGDVDICTALFIAAKTWGRGGAQGEIDYRQAAVELAGCIYQHCINHKTHMPLIGDWADPGDDAYLLTRPSDFILSGYLIFYYEDTQRKDEWGKVIQAIVNTVSGQLSLNPQTGLIADFLKLDTNSGLYYPATCQVLESDHDPHYNWNSCRVPWRIGHYYMLTRDERVRPLLETQAQFFAGQLARGGGNGDCGIKAGYRLDGTCYVDYTDMAFVAPVCFLFWVLGWNVQLAQIQQEMKQMDATYFGESIAMLCLLNANVPLSLSFSLVPPFFLSVCVCVCVCVCTMVSLSVVRYLLASIVTASTLVQAQNVINIDVPQPNSQIISKDTLNITYTVIGSQAANPPFSAQTTYPNSLSIDFVWSEHANANNVLSFSVSTGLLTDSYPGGLQNIQRKDSWKIPNCHFFSRYPPTSYDFSLVFTPNYPATIGTANVGTAQSAIIVPLAVTVDNSTFPKC